MNDSARVLGLTGGRLQGMQLGVSLLGELLLGVLVLSGLLLGGPLLGLLGSAASAQAGEPVPRGSTVRIGIVYDNESEVMTQAVGQFEAQIRELLGDDYDLRFDARMSIGRDLTRQAATAALQTMFDDPEVDIVLAAGYVASTVASHLGPLPKPTIAPFSLDAELQGLQPRPDGSSGIPNLNYLSSPAIVKSYFEVLNRVAPFQNLAIIGPEVMFDTHPGWQEGFLGRLGMPDVRIFPVLLDRDVASTLTAIPPETDAVVVLTAPLLLAEVKELADGLIARKLPSLSPVGAEDMELGILAGMRADQKVNRFSRRVALNVQRILAGTDPADLPVAFSADARLVINMATARAIGVSPPWDLRLEAVLIHDEPLPSARHLTLVGVLQEAMTVNPDVLTRRQAVIGGEQEIKRARSDWLPQADIGASGLWIDQDRAAASFGTNPERTGTASASISQLIYSEGVSANLGIQKRLQEAREHELQQVRLDVALEVSLAYLNVLRARASERIQRDNLLLNQSNLEMAQVRESIGVAGPAEVYRWESELAQRRNELIQANALRNVAEIELNRVLLRPLEQPFSTEDITSVDDLMHVDESWLRTHIGNPAEFKRLRIWLEERALAASPEIMALDAAIAAQERALKAANRAYYVPDIALQGSYDYIFHRSGVGSDFSELQDPNAPFVFPEPSDHAWGVGLFLTLPILEGGARRADQLQARSDLLELGYERESLVLRISQRVRTAAHFTGASFANIRHARDAAEAAANSLRVVSESYARGAATFLDLLEAQNNTLITDLTAANALYGFLIDYMELQRASGSFDLLLTTEERQAQLEQLEAFMAGAGDASDKGGAGEPGE